MTIAFYIIVSILLILFFYIVLTRKKRGERMEEKYKAIFAPLEEKIKDSHDWKGCNRCQIITDKEGGILALRDDEEKTAALSWTEGSIVFSFSDFTEVTVNREKGVAIVVETKNGTVSIPVSSGKFPPQSMLGRQFDAMAESMKNFLSSIEA